MKQQETKNRDMGTYREKRINRYTTGESGRYEGVLIGFPSRRMERYFNGSPSKFFRLLKNGLYSIGGVTNREFFSGLSGIYFSYMDSEKFEMLILYDREKGDIDRDGMEMRIKKLAGIDAELTFGDGEQFVSRIAEMTSVSTRTQTFGSEYFERGGQTAPE
jgi:hypothetical protein